jgi:hypothetical protein
MDVWTDGLFFLASFLLCVSFRFDGDVEVKTSDSGAAVSTGTKFVLNKCVSDVQPPVFTRVTGTVGEGKAGGRWSGVCSGVCSGD